VEPKRRLRKNRGTAQKHHQRDTKPARGLISFGRGAGRRLAAKGEAAESPSTIFRFDRVRGFGQLRLVE
jgi:hypothetical protein